MEPQDPAAPSPRWPDGWLLPLLDSDATTAPTRAALTPRLDSAPSYTPTFFDAEAYATLQAACARLVPSGTLAAPVEVAPAIDARLAADEGDGWRYDTLPPDGDAYRLGLAALDAAAQAAHGTSFASLDSPQQDAVLADAQQGRGAAFAAFDACRWFEDLLSDAVSLFVANPVVQEAIGYAGFADAPGWPRIGLGEREDREPEALGSERVGSTPPARTTP